LICWQCVGVDRPRDSDIATDPATGRCPGDDGWLWGSATLWPRWVYAREWFEKTDNGKPSSAAFAETDKCASALALVLHRAETPAWCGHAAARHGRAGRSAIVYASQKDTHSPITYPAAALRQRAAFHGASCARRGDVPGLCTAYGFEAAPEMTVDRRMDALAPVALVGLLGDTAGIPLCALGAWLLRDVSSGARRCCAAVATCVGFALWCGLLLLMAFGGTRPWAVRWTQSAATAFIGPARCWPTIIMGFSADGPVPCGWR